MDEIGTGNDNLDARGIHWEVIPLELSRTLKMGQYIGQTEDSAARLQNPQKPKGSGNRAVVAGKEHVDAQGEETLQVIQQAVCDNDEMRETIVVGFRQTSFH